MELKIALVGKGSGWIQILDQIGINYDILEDVSREILIKYPVAILTESATDREVNILKNYVETGGFILTSVGGFYRNRNFKNIKTKFVKYLIPDKTGYFNTSELVDLRTYINFLNDAHHLKSNIGLYTTSVLSIGDGKMVVLPFDAGKMYEDVTSRQKSFYFTRNRLPHEKVSKISKGPIRRLVNQSLEYLFHSQNLVYCHKWHFPIDTDNIFLFRVDTDYGKIKNIMDIYELAISHGVSISWFLDVKSQKVNFEYFKKMMNQEIALHCYDHKIFKNVKEYKDDIENALKILKMYDLNPRGYAMVYGIWDPKFANVIHKYGFSYSSEFSYDYDNLPSYDVCGNLQIPIHPICIGNLKRQGYNELEMMNYFDFIIHKKNCINEPLIFYHHPNDGNLEVIHHVFNKIKNFNYPSYSFIDYAEWWKNRQIGEYSAFVDGKILKLDINKSCSYSLRLTKEDNKEIFVHDSGTFDLSSLNWQEKKLPFEVPKDIEKVFKPNIWKIINKIEDFL